MITLRCGAKIVPLKKAVSLKTFMSLPGLGKLNIMLLGFTPTRLIVSPLKIKSPATLKTKRSEELPTIVKVC